MAKFKNRKAEKIFHRQFYCLLSLAFPTLLLGTQEKPLSFCLPNKNLEFSPTNIDRMYQVLQRKSIRDLALTIITTVENGIVVKSPLSRNSNSYKVKLLKNYLLKYQCNYFRYFVDLYPELGEPISVQELNTQAIEVLYLIYGI